LYHQRPEWIPFVRAAPVAAVNFDPRAEVTRRFLALASLIVSDIHSQNIPEQLNAAMLILEKLRAKDAFRVPFFHPEMKLHLQILYLLNSQSVFIFFCFSILN
jgi:hypothetical protein